MAAAAATAGVKRGTGAKGKSGGAQGADLVLDQPLDSRDRVLVRVLKQDFREILQNVTAEVRHLHKQQETILLKHLEMRLASAGTGTVADGTLVVDGSEQVTSEGLITVPVDVPVPPDGLDCPDQPEDTLFDEHAVAKESPEARIVFGEVAGHSGIIVDEDAEGDDQQPEVDYGDAAFPLEKKPHGAFQDFHKPSPDAKLGQEEYSVEMYYSEEGLAQRLARSNIFINTTLAVISANAVYIGIDVDNNEAVSPLDTDLGFLVADNLFCLYFTVEIVVRFLAFAAKLDCLRDGWFKFDLALVSLMVAETWISPAILMITGASFEGVPTAPLRLLRLLRLSRMVRLMRSMPELITMIKGISVASRAVASSLLMIALITYVFGIVIFMMLKEEESMIVSTKFFSLPRCMWTLLLDGTLLDSTGYVLTELLDSHSINSIVALLIFMMFILLSANTVMNMLIGVLCEVVSAVGQDERDSADVKQLKRSILLELKAFDDDGNALISDSELKHVMNNPHARSVLSNLGIDVEYLKDLQEMLFEGVEEVSIESIMDMMLMCRGDLPVEVKHVVCGQAYSRWSIKRELANMESRVNAAVHHVEAHMPHPFAALTPSPARPVQALKAPLAAGTVESPPPPASTSQPCGTDDSVMLLDQESETTGVSCV